MSQAWIKLYNKLIDYLNSNCSECGGSGQIEHDTGGVNPWGEPITALQPCPECAKRNELKICWHEWLPDIGDPAYPDKKCMHCKKWRRNDSASNPDLTTEMSGTKLLAVQLFIDLGIWGIFLFRTRDYIRDLLLEYLHIFNIADIEDIGNEIMWDISTDSKLLLQAQVSFMKGKVS